MLGRKIRTVLAILLWATTLLPAETASPTAVLRVPVSVVAGSEFEVTGTGPVATGDYVTVVPVGTAPGQYLGYFTPATPEFSGKLVAPETPGDYEVRYVAEATKQTLAAVALEVTEASATLTVPAEVDAGSSVDVDWTGPANRGDYITLAVVDAPSKIYLSYFTLQAGQPRVSLKAPESAGTYEVRYVTAAEARLLAKAPIVVRAVGASVTPPAHGAVIAGAEFEVTWTGPANRGDYVTIVPEGAEPSVYLSYVTVEAGKPSVQLTAPEVAGPHEIRYVTANEKKILASVPLVVDAARATLVHPPRVLPEASFEVTWTGPANRGDYVTIVPEGAEPSVYLSYVTLEPGKNTISLQAPAAGGPHEVRYVTAQKKIILTRGAIEVARPFVWWWWALAGVLLGLLLVFVVVLLRKRRKFQTV
jgi:Ca-activated chloride channel family protein